MGLRPLKYFLGHDDFPSLSTKNSTIAMAANLHTTIIFQSKLTGEAYRSRQHCTAKVTFGGAEKQLFTITLAVIAPHHVALLHMKDRAI